MLAKELTLKKANGKLVVQAGMWLLDPDILNRIQGSGATDLLQSRQRSALDQILNVDRMKRLIEQDFFGPSSSTYSLREMLNDLREGIWSEVYQNRPTDTFRRSIQRAYIDRLEMLMDDEDASGLEILNDDPINSLT